MRAYRYDSQQGIFICTGHEEFSYSDGTAVEERLFSVISNATDVSSSSQALADAIEDWPSEYHLSPTRHNLLRFLELGSTHRILELGCGCGAMTRFLGESGASVVAVEGSRRRAQIAAARCRDLPNVTVYCDNLINFECAEQFDYVTLIGVLEYAPKFIEGDDPVGRCLTHARSFLKANGTLVLAIENQLGLKYFNGQAEDHVGIPYYGINGLYGNTDPVTLGRHALAQKLAQTDFGKLEFFFPFPDYKMPGVILSESALAEQRLNTADLLIQHQGIGHPENHLRAFAEDQAWRAVLENRLLPDLSNSFLVLAHSGPICSRQRNWLAKMYGSCNRRPCFQLETAIERDEDMSLTVRKRRLTPAAEPPHNAWLKHVVGEKPYLTGKLLIGNVHRAMTREADIKELSASFAPWLKYLIAHSLPGPRGGLSLPGHFIDCIPGNLIVLPGDGLEYFDAEWEAAEPIPLTWVVTRGIINSINGCLENNALQGLNHDQCILRIAGRAGIDLSESDLIEAAELESRLVMHCYRRAPYAMTCRDLLSRPVIGYSRLSNEWLHRELARIKRTISWRITAPLRVSWNLLRKLIG